MSERFQGVHGPVLQEELEALLRYVRAIELTLMTAEVPSSTLGRIDHVEALTLADTIPPRQLFTIGLPQHTEGTSMVALIMFLPAAVALAARQRCSMI